MLKVKEKFFERFNQSFNLLKSNFVGLIVPIFLYNLFALIVFDILMGTFFVSKIGSIKNLDMFNIGVFLSDPSVVIMMAVGMFIFILYLLLYIIIFLSTIKSIKQSITGKQVNILENIVYGFSRFFSSMRTYWYIFAYIYLIPAIVFIIGGLLLNIGLIKDINAMTYLGGLVIVISILILISFSVYRGTKSKFALYSAIDNDSFEKENFEHSVSITNKDWWRVFGNIFLVLLIIGFGTSIIEGILSMIIFGASGGGSVIFQGITSAINSNNPEIAISTITEYMQNKSIFYDLFKNIFSIILQSIGTVFVFVFMYLFYLRLFRDAEYFKNNGQDIILKQKDKLEAKNDINQNIEL